MQGQWLATQPGKGIVGTLICFMIAFGITVAFTGNMDAFAGHGLFTSWSISMVPILVIMGLAWGGKYPAARLEQPWKGFAGLAFMFAIGSLACWWLLKFVGGGAGNHPLVAVFIICVVIVTFFMVIAFGCWPFHKLSLPAKGFLSLLVIYLIMLPIFRLFNFDRLAAGFPDGVPWAGVPATPPDIPFYSAGGPMAALAGVNPGGPIGWEAALTFMFWMVIFLFVFVHLGMWPISKVKGLMTQPALGITLVILTFGLAFAAYAVGVWAIGLEPIRFMLIGISYAFGMLMLIMMFQMWPGRTWKKQPTWGLVNLLLAVVIAIVAFYGIRGFCNVVFTSDFMVYPFEWFAMANVMLALIFPMWAVHEALFDYYPLPPTPAP